MATRKDGTTDEQWMRYADELKSHIDYMEANKPIEPNHLDYKEEKFKGELTFRPGMLEKYSNDYDIYLNAKSEWDKAYHMDAPNKPGYYRANND